MSATQAGTYTITDADVEKTFRRFRADLKMIAESSQAFTVEKAEIYAHDAELLAKKRFLAYVDITLLDDGVEVRAMRYIVNQNSGNLEASRPGNALWPKVWKPRFRIVLSYTAAYTDEQKKNLASSLKIGWVNNYEDISHASLRQTTARNYVSNDYGLERKDYEK
jgi:hypothetical protein